MIPFVLNRPPQGAARPQQATAGNSEPQLFTPWLRAAAALFLLAVVVVGDSLRGKISDPDLWWHLRTGALIVQSHHVPTTDSFSYSAYGQPWVAHEWLTEVVFHALFRGFGF